MTCRVADHAVVLAQDPLNRRSFAFASPGAQVVSAPGDSRVERGRSRSSLGVSIHRLEVVPIKERNLRMSADREPH